MSRLLCVLIPVLLLAACVGEDRLQSKTIVVEPGVADFANIVLNLSTGNLTLTGGADNLFEGEFRYQQSDFIPTHTYEQEMRGQWLLRVDQPSIAENTEEGDHYVSEVRLGDAISYNLTLSKTEGRATFDFRGLPINELFVNPDHFTADETEAVLVAEEDGVEHAQLEATNRFELTDGSPTLTLVRLAGGAGEDQVAMQGDYSSLLQVDMALDEGHDGVAVNGTFPSLIALSIQMGHGGDTVEIAGEFPTLETFVVVTGDDDDCIQVAGNFLSPLRIEVGAGEDEVDLVGPWTHDTQVTIVSADQTTTLYLPQDIGVRVQVSSRAAQINAEGLSQAENTYTNDLYETADIKLDVVLNTFTSEVINLFDLRPVSDDVEACN